MTDEKNAAEPSGASGGYGERGPDLRGPAVIVDGSVIGGFIARGGLRLPFLIGGLISLVVVAFSFKRIVQIGEESVAISKENER